MEAVSSTSADTGNEPNATVNASIEISKLIDAWFKSGSYPLVAIGLGALITFAYVAGLNLVLLRGGDLPLPWHVLLGLGVSLIAGGFVTVAIAGARAHKTVSTKIREYESAIETAHDFSRDAISAIRNLNELLFTHVDTVAQVIDAAKPILAMFGGASFANSRYLESDLVAFSNSAQEVIANVERAITKVDIEALRQYRYEIGVLAATTKNIVGRVKSGEWAAKELADFSQSISSARQAALAYSDSATNIHDRISATLEPVIAFCDIARNAPFAAQSIGKHIDALQDIKLWMRQAEDANLAVRAAIRAPGKEKFEAAMLQVASLRAAGQ
jgi:hypothetical protein